MNGFILKAAFIIILIFSLLGCSKNEPLNKKTEFETYIIPAGKHSSISKIRVLYKEEITFAVKFDSSAIYTTVDPVNQFSTNKLYGFSDCNTIHQENSARIGWRWFNNQLEILAYCYINSERFFENVTTLEIGNEYECSIKIIDDNYQFSINGAMVNIKRGCATEHLKYCLYPYFGGTEGAPHDIKIEIKDL